MICYNNFMKHLIFRRSGDKCLEWGTFFLRVAVGAVFAAHGWQKISGGVEGVSGFFGSVGIPAPTFFAYIVSYVEFLGGIALILGLFTYWVSILLAIIMVVALFTVHLPNGFYVNKGGYEFVLVLLASAATLNILGPGRFALENKLIKQN